MSNLEDIDKFTIQNNALVQGQIIGDNNINIITQSTDHYSRYLDEYLRALQHYGNKNPYTSLANILHLKHDETEHIYIPPYVNMSNEQVTEMDNGKLPITDVLNGITSGLFKPHVLILGEPGIGKSMLLRFIAKYAYDKPSTLGLSHSYLVFPIRCQSLALADGDSVETRISKALLRDSEILLQADPPNGFLFEWTRRVQQHVFFLLDGLDEVPRASQEELWTWLRNLLAYTKQHGANTHFVLTSRPITELIEQARKIFNPSDKSQQTTLDICQLQLFDTLQQQRFVEHWLDQRAQAFLQEIQSSPIQPLMKVPLLLSIAIATYEKKGHLTKQRLTLYDQFIEICLNEADKNLLRRDLEPERTEDDRPIFENERKVLDVMASSYRPILERLALSMTEHPEKISIESLSNEVGSYLQDAYKLPRQHTQKWIPRFLEIMSRRSGVLMRSQQSYEWLHPTIREYLAARALYSKHKKKWSQFVKGRWANAQWQGVTIFFLTMLDRDTINTAKFTRFLRRKMHKQNLDSCFSCFNTIFIYILLFIFYFLLFYLIGIINIPFMPSSLKIIFQIFIPFVLAIVWYGRYLINSETTYDEKKDALHFLLRWLAYEPLPDDIVYDILKVLLENIYIGKLKQAPKPQSNGKQLAAWYRHSHIIQEANLKANLDLEVLKELDAKTIKSMLKATQSRASVHIQREAQILLDMFSSDKTEDSSNP